VLFISEQAAADILSPKIVRDIVLSTLGTQPPGSGLSDPRSLFLRPAGRQCSYHVKGAWLAAGGTPVAGFRLGGFPRGHGDGIRLQAVLLTELDSGVPLAMIAAERLGALRVGAAVGTAVELLRATPSRTLALIGTGRLAKAVLRALHETAPPMLGQTESFAAVRVTSRSPERRQRFAEEMARENVRIDSVDTPAAACAGADVIVTVTNADEPLIQTAWCRPGSLLVSAGGCRECADEAILGADKIFVDDWEQCTVLGDIAALHRLGRIHRDDITGTLSDIIAGRAPGRESDCERIVAVPQGLAVLDVALARFVYEKAVAASAGVTAPWP
jgi:ornithine cyclodeaminase/alanine dehydrogenase-like protein (mu-crystallin family)